MALPLKINVTESIVELRALQRKNGELINKRLKVLIEIKKHEKTGISKRQLSDITGVNHNSIVKWRRIYNDGGISPLLSHGRIGGFKKSVFSDDDHNKLEKKLNDPNNGIQGYTELLEWVKTDLGKDIKYITLLKYSQRHFETKIKVARKSHVKKDVLLVEDFKKTSEINATIKH
jgi:transposase